MRFKVYLLRRRGRRLSWREAQNGPAYIGRLVTHTEEHGGDRYSVTSVQPDDPIKADEMQRWNRASSAHAQTPESTAAIDSECRSENPWH